MRCAPRLAAQLSAESRRTNDSATVGRRTLDLRADDRAAATLDVLSPMCDVVIAAAQTLTVDDLCVASP